MFIENLLDTFVVAIFLSRSVHLSPLTSTIEVRQLRQVRNLLFFFSLANVRIDDPTSVDQPIKLDKKEIYVDTSTTRKPFVGVNRKDWHIQTA